LEPAQNTRKQKPIGILGFTSNTRKSIQLKITQHTLVLHSFSSLLASLLANQSENWTRSWHAKVKFSQFTMGMVWRSKFVAKRKQPILHYSTSFDMPGKNIYLALHSSEIAMHELV